MKAGIVTAVLLFAASHAAAETVSDATLRDLLIDLEKQSWVAWKGHDAAFFSRFLSDDHVEVGPRGVLGKADIVAGVASPACKVESYAVDKFKFTRVAEDVALLSYLAQQKTACGGVAVPSPAWAASLYVKRDGRWVNVLYQQTPAAS
jgi:hypothetical protein